MAKKQSKAQARDDASIVEPDDRGTNGGATIAEHRDAAGATEDEASDIQAILLKENYLTAQDVARVEQISKERGITFEQAVLSSGTVTRELMGQAIAESRRVPYADLSTTPPTAEQVQKIPEEIAKKYRVVVFTEDAHTIVVATDTPGDPTCLREFEQLFPGKNVVFAYALSESIDASFVHYQKPLDTRFSKILEGTERVAPELLEAMFDDALAYHASDIHLEPRQKDVRVRFRVDGVLYEAGRIPREYYENV